MPKIRLNQSADQQFISIGVQTTPGLAEQPVFIFPEASARRSPPKRTFHDNEAQNPTTSSNSKRPRIVAAAATAVQNSSSTAHESDSSSSPDPNSSSSSSNNKTRVATSKATRLTRSAQPPKNPRHSDSSSNSSTANNSSWLDIQSTKSSKVNPHHHPNFRVSSLPKPRSTAVARGAGGATTSSSSPRFLAVPVYPIQKLTSNSPRPAATKTVVTTPSGSRHRRGATSPSPLPRFILDISSDDDDNDDEGAENTNNGIKVVVTRHRDHHASPILMPENHLINDTIQLNNDDNFMMNMEHEEANNTSGEMSRSRSSREKSDESHSASISSASPPTVVLRKVALNGKSSIFISNNERNNTSNADSVASSNDQMPRTSKSPTKRQTVLSKAVSAAAASLSRSINNKSASSSSENGEPEQQHDDSHENSINSSSFRTPPRNQRNRSVNTGEEELMTSATSSLISPSGHRQGQTSPANSVSTADEAEDNDDDIEEEGEHVTIADTRWMIKVQNMIDQREREIHFSLFPVDPHLRRSERLRLKRLAVLQRERAELMDALEAEMKARRVRQRRFRVDMRNVTVRRGNPQPHQRRCTVGTATVESSDASSNASQGQQRRPRRTFIALITRKGKRMLV